MKVAFFACSRNQKLFRSDPSYIYRCENLGLGLIERGHQVDFCHINDPVNTKSYDIVVFHRPRNLWRVWILAKIFRLKGVKVWADFDDLIFDKNFAIFSPGFINGINAFKKTQKIYQSHQATLSLFDAFTVSTEPLKAYLYSLQPKKKSIVLPNAPHYSWQRGLVEFTAKEIDFAKPILTYLPGTRSHDKDFKCIAEPLTRFLWQNPQVRLEITGPLSFQLNAELSPQVFHSEKVDFVKFHERFQSTWVNIAPLEDTPFNECKSALKVLEAGFWGKPTICSPIPDALRYKNAGALFIETPDDIYTKLTMLLDPDYYASKVCNLRNRVLQVSNINEVALKFIEAANSK